MTNGAMPAWGPPQGMARPGCPPAGLGAPGAPGRGGRALGRWLAAGGVVVAGGAVAVVLVVMLGGVRLPSIGCDLVSRSTASTYAPGASCKYHSGSRAVGRIGRTASWEGGSESGRYQDGSIEVQVEQYTTSARAQRDYTTSRRYLLSKVGNADVDGWPASHARDVDGLGDRAFVVYNVDNEMSDNAGAWAIVMTGNAVIQIDYDAAIAGDSASDHAAIPPGEAENGALAMARDALKQLGWAGRLGRWHA